MALDFGNVPQWITAGIAATAGWLAYTSLQSQRVIARRRAAFDIFLKTETDEKMLTAFDNFHAGIQAMRKASSVEAFCTSEDERCVSTISASANILISTNLLRSASEKRSW